MPKQVRSEYHDVVVYSESVDATTIIRRIALQWGKARAITIENGTVAESANDDYVVVVRVERTVGDDDSWALTLGARDCCLMALPSRIP